MLNLSSLIASIDHRDERKSTGPWAAGVFVAVMLAGAASAAYLVGNAMSANASEIPPITLVSEEF